MGLLRPKRFTSSDISLHCSGAISISFRDRFSHRLIISLLIPQLGLRLDPSSISFMVALATASAAASNTASAECMYLLVIECVLWPSKLAMVGSL